MAAVAVCAPASGTTSHADAQRSPSRPSAGIRRRPRTSRAIGSWTRTTTIVFTRNTIPIWISDTPASFFA